MELKFILEAILFHAQKPLNVGELKDLLVSAAVDSPEDPTPKTFKKTKAEDITAALESLDQDHKHAQRSYRLACIAGAWQFVSQPEFAPWLRTMFGTKARPPRLSQPALETLAIVAYRQPITRAEIEQIRGVSVDGVIQTLLERSLIVQTGRAEVVGRPITFGTTAAFLEYFGLRSLEDLPAADELRRIEIKKPEALLTVEPGLATIPPDSLTTETSVPPTSAPEVRAPAGPATEPGTPPEPTVSLPDAPQDIQSPGPSPTSDTATESQPEPAPTAQVVEPPLENESAEKP